jgi:hypothetical protein
MTLVKRLEMAMAMTPGRLRLRLFLQHEIIEERARVNWAELAQQQ